MILCVKYKKRDRVDRQTHQALNLKTDGSIPSPAISFFSIIYDCGLSLYDHVVDQDEAEMHVPLQGDRGLNLSDVIGDVGSFLCRSSFFITGPVA